MTASGGLKPLGDQPLEVVALLDEKDRIAWISPGVTLLTGWAVDELVGNPGLDLVHPDDREALEHLLVEMRGSPLALSMTLRATTRDGVGFPVEAVVTNLVDEPGLNTVSLSLRPLERSSPTRRTRRRPHHAQTVLDSLTEGVLVLLGDGTVLSCNEAAPRLLGTERDRLIGHHLGEAIAATLGEEGSVRDEAGGGIDPRADEALLIVSKESPGGTVRELRLGDGSVRVLSFRTSYLAGQETAASGLEHRLVTVSDVTALRHADEERRAALSALAGEREFLGALVSNLDAGVIACDANGVVTVTNATFRLFGDYLPEQVAPGTEPPVGGMYWPDGSPVDPDDHPLRQALAGVRVSGAEFVFRPESGVPPRYVSTSASVIRGESGVLLGAVAGFQDVTEAKETARELSELALHDPLTGCANRLLLSDRVELATDFARREKLHVGLLVIDLDDFKEVNDTHGHLVGDEVLIGVATRLRSVVRPGDTVARYGGDEFVILCQISGGVDELRAVRERIELRLAEPFSLGGISLKVGASVGSAFAPGKEADFNRLLRAADAEMYETKRSRRQESPPLR